MAGLFDDTPVGLVRSRKSRGWLIPTRPRNKGKIDKLAQENANLKARLDALEAMIEGKK
jgi:hypothetical protein